MAEKVESVKLMVSLRASLREWRWRHLAFSLVVLVFLGMVGFIGMVLLQPGLIAGLLGQNMAYHISQHFRSLDHRIHDFTFSLIFATSVVGMLAQLRKPRENIAGQVIALIPWVVLALVSALTNKWVFAPLPILGGLTLLAAVLHPDGRDFFRSFSVSRMSRTLLVLVIIAAVPLLMFASTNIGLQTGAINEHGGATDGMETHNVEVHQEHVDRGHFGFMADFSFIVIGIGLLASLRPRGWRLAAWVAGFLPALLGFASLVYPDNSSSFVLAWSLAAIVWSVTFVAATEFIRLGNRTHPVRADQP